MNEKSTSDSCKIFCNEKEKTSDNIKHHHADVVFRRVAYLQKNHYLITPWDAEGIPLIKRNFYGDDEIFLSGF